MGINVLSLFDSISAGQVALERAGIKVNTYLASEVDKYAKAVTQYRYPNTIQVGDISNLFFTGSTLYNKQHKISIWNGTIDIIFGGPPCQSYSLAGKRGGLEDERGNLFLDAIRLVGEIQPKLFMFENVKGLISHDKGKTLEYLLNLLRDKGYFVDYTLINSALVSAQNRERIYIIGKRRDLLDHNCTVVLPEDKGILLKDIIEEVITDRDKSYCIDANYAKGASYEQYIKKSRRQLVGVVNYTEVRTDEAIKLRKEIREKTGKDYTPFRMKKLIPRKDEKVNCLQTSLTNNHQVCIKVGEADIKGIDSIKRIYSTEGKCPCLTTMGGGHREPKIEVTGCAQRGRYNKKGSTDQKIELNNKHKTNSITTVQKDSMIAKYYEGKDGIIWRKLTPKECSRLQTFDDDYNLIPWKNRMMSNSQMYKQMGNSWTIDVIVHIFKKIKELL